MQTAPRSTLDGIVILLAAVIGPVGGVASDLDGPAALAVGAALAALVVLTVAGPRALWGRRESGD